MASPHDALLTEVRGIPGVHDPAVVSRTGNLMAGSFGGNQHGDTVAAMAAIIHASGESLGQEFRRPFVHVVVNFEKGALVVIPAGNDALLVTTVDSGTTLAEALPALHRASARSDHG